MGKKVSIIIEVFEHANPKWKGPDRGEEFTVMDHTVQKIKNSLEYNPGQKLELGQVQLIVNDEEIDVTFVKEEKGQR